MTLWSAQRSEYALLPVGDPVNRQLGSTLEIVSHHPDLHSILDSIPGKIEGAEIIIYDLQEPSDRSET